MYGGPINGAVQKLGLDNQKTCPCWNFQLHLSFSLAVRQPQECKRMLFWMWGKVRELSLPAAILITAFVPGRDSSGMDAVFLHSQEDGLSCTYKWQLLLNPPVGFWICSPSDVAWSLTHFSPPSTFCMNYGIATWWDNCVAGFLVFFSPFHLLKLSLGRRSRGWDGGVETRWL